MTEQLEQITIEEIYDGLLSGRRDFSKVVLEGDPNLAGYDDFDKLQESLRGQNLQENPIIFSYSQFRGLIAPRLYLPYIKCVKANLRRANFTRADFTRADFRVADLRGANFTEADFTEADFRGADLEGAKFTGAKFTGADLIGADLQGANFEGANFEGAYLGGAYLKRANFI